MAKQLLNGVLVDKEGNKYTENNKYLNTVTNQLNTLKGDDPDVKDMINTLETNKYKNEITNYDEDRVEDSDANQTRGESSLFKFGMRGITQFDAFSEKDPKTKELGENAKRKPKIGLVHELTHMFDRNIGVSEYKTEIGDGKDKQKTTSYEKHARHVENKIRRKTGDPLVAE
jgi:hypothetical protein